MLLTHASSLSRTALLVAPQSLRCCSLPRAYATEASVNVPTQPELDKDARHVPARRVPKNEGTIAEFFTNLTTKSPPLPSRFADLKKEIYVPKLEESWREVLQELKGVTDEVARLGDKVVPQVRYEDVVNGLSEEQVKAIKKTGTVIVKGVVPKEEALGWKRSLLDYIDANKDKVKGSPPEQIVFYELYNAKAQILARTHPAVVNTQLKLLSMWHASDPTTPVSLNTPITYFDRVRVRPPGPSSFVLGPHIDGGSLERWEDPNYRKCFRKILEGKWKEHDPFDVSPRIDANMDLYHAPNQCTVFRPWQSWTSLSTTGPREGTLRLLPFLYHATAYIMLRPFFRPRNGLATSLAPEDWEVDLDGTDFPGSEMGKTQGVNKEGHPHLRIDETMVSLPQVEPGDQVYWHCDLPHAVEAEHTGKGDSSVFYIPAVPLTVGNSAYLRDQLANFMRGAPAPDFPGGEGESTFVGRGIPEDVKTVEGRRVLGLSPYDVTTVSTPGAQYVVEQANKILFK